jgi:hypothetical protein
MSNVLKVAWLVLSVVAPATSQGRVEAAGSTRHFISQKFGFSMAVPAGWGVSTALDTPVYFYSPSSAKFIQDAIPPGGAVITTEPHDSVTGLGRSATTPEAWAAASAGALTSSSPSIEPFQMPKESGASRAVICSYDEATFSPDEHTQHSVAVFWEFNRKLFAAHLNYNATDSNGPTLEKIFLRTVRSFRPLDRH